MLNLDQDCYQRLVKKPDKIKVNCIANYISFKYFIKNNSLYGFKVVVSSFLCVVYKFKVFKHKKTNLSLRNSETSKQD